MKRIVVGFLFALSCSAALAQSGAPVKQSGNVTPNQVPVWITSGVIGGGTTAADSPISSLGVTGPICSNSTRQASGAWNSLCLQANTGSAAVISLQNYGTAAAQNLVFNVNGTLFPLSSTGVINVAQYGAIPNDNTKAAVNQTAFAAAYVASGAVTCSPGLTYYVQKITIPITAVSMSGCNLIAAGTYAGNDGVVSVVNNTAGFTFDKGSISANGVTYPTTAGILVTGSMNFTVSNSVFPAAARTVVGANNTNFRMLYNTITSYVYNVLFDSGGSIGVWVTGNKASGGTDTNSVVWDDNTFIVVSGIAVSMQYNTTIGSKFWSYSVQNTTHFNISNNISVGNFRECIAAGISSGTVSDNECSFDNNHTDYCMSFSSSYTTVTNNNCIEPRFTGFYFLNGLGGSFTNNTVATPATTNNVGTGWTLLYIEGTTTGLSVANNQVYDKYGTLSWYYWRVSGSPAGNYFYTPVGPTPSQGIFGNSLDQGTGTFNTRNLTINGIASGTQCLHANSVGNVSGLGSDCVGAISPTITTPTFLFSSGAQSEISAGSTNTGFANVFTVKNAGTLSNSGTTGNLAAQLTAGSDAQIQMIAIGGANPLGRIVSGTGLTGGLNIVANAGTISMTGLPTSAGTGGLFVCIDTSGVLYKKAACP